MVLRIEFQNKRMGDQFRHGMIRNADKVATSAASALKQAEVQILERGRRQIASAGNFKSDRWQKGLQAEIKVVPPRDLVLSIRHLVPYFNIFQYGGVIRGKPLLWIPLSYTGLKIRAREYGRRYGLFRVDRKSDGLPLLLSMRDRKPKYFGKESVTMPKKFYVVEICRDVAKNLRGYYRKAFDSAKPSDASKLKGKL